MEIKRGDTEPVFSVEPSWPRGGGVDFSNVSEVLFYLERLEDASDEVLLNGAAASVNEEESRVEYDFEEGDTDMLGEYRAEFELVWDNGDRAIFPTSGYYTIRVVETIPKP